MNPHRLSIALLAVGAMAALLRSPAHAAAFEPSAALTQRVVARANNVPASPIAPTRPALDYRAIVEAGNPAVVGVAVVGLHTPTADDKGEQVAAKASVLQFQRGLPTLFNRSNGHGPVPFRRKSSGFIISSDGLIPRIVATGQVIHARLGVTVQDLDQALAEAFGLARPHGALISSVAKDSPAERFGLHVGDGSTQAGGRLLEHPGSLPEAVALATPGDVVQLELWRDGAAQGVDVRLGQAPLPVRLSMQQPARDNKPNMTPAGPLGLLQRVLTAQERRELGDPVGLVVERVAGAALRAGVQPGDLIKAINSVPVHALEQALALTQAITQTLAQGKPKSVALLVQRGGESLYVPVIPG